MALQDYRNDMMRCVRCSVCKFIPLSSLFKSWRYSVGCPAIKHYKFHSYSASGKLITALSHLDGRTEYSQQYLDIIYRCTLCGMCETSCKTGTDMELLQIFKEMRRKCVADGYGPMPQHKPIIDSMKHYDNVWMQPRSRRNTLFKKSEVKDLRKEKADVLYFVGCTYSLDPGLTHVSQNTARLLMKGGVDLGALGADERCCASPAYMIGDMEIYEKFARENIEMFNNLGVSKVVTSCAGCFGLLKTHYPQLGVKMNFEVVHASEMLAQLIEAGKLSPKQKVDRRVTFHDPCHLGRMSEPREASGGVERRELGILPVKPIEKVIGYRGVFDPPRIVIDSIPGLKFNEMERIREYSWCCGAGAGVKSAFPDFATATAAERLQEAESTGADILLSSCPWCEKNLSDGIKESGTNLQVYDITDLLIESVE